MNWDEGQENRRAMQLERTCVQYLDVSVFRDELQALFQTAQAAEGGVEVSEEGVEVLEVGVEVSELDNITVNYSL